MAQPVYIVRGASDREAIAFALIAALAGIVYGIYSLYEYLHSWPSFSEPYNFIGAFYYYSIVVPIDSFIMVWYKLQEYELTIYPNVNFIVSLLGIIAYAFLVKSVLQLSMFLLAKLRVKLRYVVLLMFLPAVISLFWYLGNLFLSWLFATQ